MKSGCRPMPRREGTASEPGRSRERERKRASGAREAGERARTFAGRVEEGEPEAEEGSEEAMTELAGSARPRTPLKSGESGSLETEDAAAG